MKPVKLWDDKLDVYNLYGMPDLLMNSSLDNFLDTSHFYFFGNIIQIAQHLVGFL